MSEDSKLSSARALRQTTEHMGGVDGPLVLHGLRLIESNIRRGVLEEVQPTINCGMHLGKSL